jgi:hypothetical protein
MQQSNNKRKNFRYHLLIFFLFIIPGSVFSQTNLNKEKSIAVTDSIHAADNAAFVKQRDLIDLFLMAIKKNPTERVDDNKKQVSKLHFSGAPSPSYSLATGFTMYIAGNFAFYTGNYEETNISSVLVTPFYTLKKQFSAPIQFSIWTKKNKFYIIGDWRFMAYPEATYGLGGQTPDSNAVSLNYDYVRMYSFILKTLAKNFYAGLGYQYDNHWNIEQFNVPSNTITDFSKYGFSKNSISSGISADVLFDSRKNSINPEAGSSYANIVFRQNLKFLGSDQNWESLLIDARKYIRLSENSKNILALWSYNFLTLRGNPPYMDLPSTGWDTYGNTGRGYVQSRFRSKNMVDLEAEYRFGILSNGLLGGVVFGNLQTYSDFPNSKFENINPGYGAGIRIKFNKYSRTNVCLDYAFGLHNSNGMFINLGEVF